MSFSFNFSPPGEETAGDYKIREECDIKDLLVSDATASQENPTKAMSPCQIHSVSKEGFKPHKAGDFSNHSLPRSNFILRYINPTVAEQNATQSNENLKVLLQSSDLQSGEYEGGLKVWECTFDLLSYLHDHLHEWKDTRHTVLDLGCGAGLLGIYMMLQGAQKVWLQDYNKEVITEFTIPSVVESYLFRNYNKTYFEDDNTQKDKDDTQATKTNSTQQQQSSFPPSNCVDTFLIQSCSQNNLPQLAQTLTAINQSCVFVSGDWENISSNICTHDSSGTERKLELILSSETIYNIEYYPKILRVLTEHLHERGTAYFAAKTHYFGVGGGTLDFTEFLDKNKLFRWKTAWRSTNGLQREIIQVNWRPE